MTDINPGQHSTAAHAGITEWHRIITELDWDQLPDLLVDDVTYHSPAEYAPHRGKVDMVTILRLVFTMLEDFTYLRQFSNDTGYVLEFSARVGDVPLVGADLVELDTHGKITDVQVMMRPASAVQALADEAAKRMAGG